MTESTISPGNHAGNDDGRQDKTTAGHQQPPPSSPFVTDMNGHLRAIRTGNKIGRADQIEEMVMIHPVPPVDHFFLHHSDMRRGTAECGQPEATEKSCQLARRSSL